MEVIPIKNVQGTELGLKFKLTNFQAFYQQINFLDTRAVKI